MHHFPSLLQSFDCVRKTQIEEKKTNSLQILHLFHAYSNISNHFYVTRFSVSNNLNVKCLSHSSVNLILEATNSK